MILELLEAKGIDYVITSEGVAITCPNQNQHQGGIDSDPSFRINTEKEASYCFSCGFKLNQAGLHRWLRGEDIDDLQLLGMEVMGCIKRIQESQPSVDISVDDETILFPRGEPISWDYRGISKEFYKELGGVVPTRGRYQDRLCFPVTVNGRLLGVDGRALKDDMKPKYLRNKGCSCSEDWLSFFDYTKELIRERRISYVILAEGIFHSINGLYHGFPTVCFFGANNMSITKVMLLLDLGVDEVIYFPDLDEAGWKAQIEITQMLLPWFKVTWPDTSQIPIDEEASEKKGKVVYKDLGDLSKDEIQWALDNRSVVRMR